MDEPLSKQEKVVPTTVDISLPDDVLEKLYQSYSIKQKRPGLGCFLAASILFDLWAIFVPQGQSWESLGVTCIFLVANVLLVIFLKLCGKSQYSGAVWEIAPHLAWLLAIKQLFLQLLLKGSVTPRDSLGWAIILNFLVYVTLPIPLKFAGILLGLGSCATYISTIIGLAKKENWFWEQQIANLILIITSALIGLLCYFLGEAKQRRAFLEAKQSLEVKMLIEEQSAEQERLLLSVLPEHVAVKMRQDLGSTNSEQFKKIYMSRHENVSILYADIVGFTAISSTYCAQDLVKILNELFARFDRLAEKYQQLRIKILGDCYYCISGAPVERPDHAVLCVHMGLSMVKAIKYVQQKTNSPVDMRVGIHTGAILAGILGQRQWQYDVYSKDVEIANKMESSGNAGRVHISDKTLGYLNGEFEVEPAFGEKREEVVRAAGLKTYFITKVIKPFVPLEYKNGTTTTKSETKDSIEPDGPSGIFRDDDEFATPGDEDPRSLDIQKCDDDSSEDFKLRLRKELVSRDGHGELWRDINICLTFKNNELETAYTLHRQPFSSVPLIGFLIVHVAGGLYSIFVLPRTITHFAIVFVPIWILIFLVIISVAESFPAVFPYFISQSSKKFNDCVWLRRMAAIITILIVGLCNCFDMFTSSQLEPTNADNIFVILLNQTVIKDHIMQNVCLFPSYYSNYCVLVLIAVSVIVQLSHISKIILMILIAALHCLINVFYMEKQFTNEEYHTWNHGLPLRYSLSALLVAVTIALSLLARHMDKEDRVIFLWKNEVTEQKEKASDMRRRNEALVYNVLPMHVAEHFMGNRKRSHDELYSQSYAEVGVLFASMPNFSDFYSEETVNNQGLECLRFLNEVISDFDALLELPQFQDIIKIKTIGSTYMAASGLNPSRQVKSEDPTIIRWAHLALLVEFALELKKALQSINEQSFNHFVLKMGVNHGPITAGVIGARKPHYDIWGNTVNVASRMESTGKAGAIQVTEETCEILQTFGYTFEQRGLVAVKGKGQLMTYYLQGKIPRQSMNQTSPMISANMSTMETVQEVEEPHEAPPIKPAIDGSPATGLHHASISSSSASPNSVKLNSNYIDKNSFQQSHQSQSQLQQQQQQQPQQQHQTKISINIQETNENNSNDNKTLITNNSSCNNSNISSNNNVPCSHLNSSNSDSDIIKNGGIVNPNAPAEADETGNDSDVTTPLLNDKNSTNFNSNDYCIISEKDSLIDSTK